MPERNKPHLIYLDDEEINLMFFREMFKLDFDIFTTSSPLEAIEYLKSNEVDFVLTDQLMPEMTGVQFLKKLKAEKITTDSTKIMVSGYAKAGEVKAAMDSKLIREFVSKPWSYDGIVNLLKELQ